MSDTIEGLKIDVQGAELVSLIRDKGQEHATKAAAYEKQAGEVEALKPAQGQTNDPVTSLKQTAREHAKKAVLFEFIADHLSELKTYRLSEQDLIRVEIIDRW